VKTESQSYDIWSVSWDMLTKPPSKGATRKNKNVLFHDDFDNFAMRVIDLFFVGLYLTCYSFYYLCKLVL
jgi:hypothetical protein